MASPPPLVRPLSFAAVDRYLGHQAVAMTAARLRVSRRTVQRWRRYGLNVYAADAIATSLGLHPTCLFGPEWETAPTHREPEPASTDRASHRRTVAPPEHDRGAPCAVGGPSECGSSLRSRLTAGASEKGAPAQ